VSIQSDHFGHYKILHDGTQVSDYTFQAGRTTTVRARLANVSVSGSLIVTTNIAAPMSATGWNDSESRSFHVACRPNIGNATTTAQ